MYNELFYTTAIKVLINLSGISREEWSGVKGKGGEGRGSVGLMEPLFWIAIGSLDFELSLFMMLM